MRGSMERRLPPGSRPSIPDGYGTYLAPDLDSPTPSQETSQSQSQRRRAPGGGSITNITTITTVQYIETKPWEAGALLYPEDLPEQQQNEGQQDQSPPLQRWDPPPGAGTAASGSDTVHPPSGYGAQNPGSSRDASNRCSSPTRPA